ncbi:kynureninase [Segetibacter aerophilus]|uniref:Kynureninase n=1 Tax=Segetibacter aerophilus TaxID=670293 RepID=A0A512BH21_9BACT|nr:kynureninase [Segetibacter aerophilus]GEO11268.1 kynureninase [Segetibacter aerophilus]
MNFEASLQFAQQKDNEDKLGIYKQQFYFPQIDDRDTIYFCGNSLGLQSKKVQASVQQELDDWKNLGIAGFLNAKNPWMYYQEYFKKSLSKIVGCKEEEVTVMNSLTVNLHLLMLTFYRPTETRYKIIMEAGAFPSDQYAVETQVKHHGFNPEEAVIEIAPREGEKTLRHEDIISAIETNGASVAMVMLGGINYYSGQLFDIQSITEATQKVGAIAGFDLAHASGNVHLDLHNWNVDFAVWCSYKYLNGGPGAVGGLYVHERYATDPSTPRFAGWWGNDEQARFKMKKGFVAKPNASGWNISTAQILNMASLKASLDMFEEAGFENIKAKSKDLTAYLEFLLQQLQHLDFEIITPANAESRGAQLSLYFKEKGKEIHEKMIDSGIVVDYREPGVVRVAPAPLYCSYQDVYRFYEILKNFD